MNDKVTLQAGHFPEGKVRLMTQWVASRNWVLHRNLIENNDVFLDDDTARTALGTEGVTVEVWSDENATALFAQGGSREAFRRTPWFVSDDQGDGVLFVAEDGRYTMIDRRLVELFGLQTLYGPLQLPNVKEQAWPFCDAPDDQDPRLIVMPCKVKLPPTPPLKAWQSVQRLVQQPIDVNADEQPTAVAGKKTKAKAKT
jgi:hypothetical protein